MTLSILARDPNGALGAAVAGRLRGGCSRWVRWRSIRSRHGVDCRTAADSA